MKIIKKGYKQTEVGVIPEDWEETSVGKIVKITTGNRNTQDKDDNGKYPFFVRSDKIEHINTFSYDGEGVLTAGDGVGTGKVFHYINGKFDYHQRVYLMSKFEKIIGKYFYWYFSNYFFDRVSQMTAKSSVDSVRREMIEKMPIVVPSNKSEQCAISTALSDIDSLISSLNKKIEKKKNIKQGLMQQLLTGKKRLPGFNGEWIEKKLGDVAIIKDGTHQTPKYVENGGIPFYSVENVSSNDFKHVKQISYAEHKILTKSYKIEIGDVLMTRIGSIGVCKYVDWNVDASFYVSLALLKIKLDNDARFIAFYSNLKCFKDEIDLNSLIFAIPQKINLGNISFIKIKVPPTKIEQTAIATILSDVDKDILATEASRDKYIQIKSAMMQQLLTGKIRLVEPLQEKECSDEAKVVPIDAHIVGGHIVKKLYASKGWGRTKFQKSLHLIGYCCQLDFGNEYIRNTAGPDDEKLMNYIDSKFKQYHHVVKEKEIFSNGHTHYIYKPTPQITELEQAFASYPVKLRHRINALLDKIFNMDLARAEIVSTLYAVWNNRIIKGQEISDSLILSDFYDWSKHKSDFSKDLVLKALDYMRNNDIIPIGWGKYIDKK